MDIYNSNPRFVEVTSCEVKEIIISSSYDSFPPEDDPDLIVKINIFKIENPNLYVRGIEFNSPDDEGYENSASVFVSELPWYRETLNKNQKVILKNKEYYIFWWPNEKGIMRVLDKESKELIYYDTNTGIFSKEELK